MKRNAALILLLASTAWAQSPSTRPSERPPGQVLDQMLGGPKPGKPMPPLPSGPPAVDTATTRPGVAPGSPPQAVLREGTLLVDRTGRMVRSPDGTQVEFVFDADGTTMKDPPVVILPNLRLLQMENAAASVSRDLRFRITGVVTEYRSRNYVLLDKAVVVSENEGRL